MGVGATMSHQRKSRRRHAMSISPDQLDSEELGSVLAEASVDFVCLTTAHGEPFYLNPAGRRMVGLSADLPLSGISAPRLVRRAIVGGIAQRRRAGGQQDRTLGRSRPAPPRRHRRNDRSSGQHVPLQVERGRAPLVFGDGSSACRRGRGPAEGAGRGAGPKKVDPRILSRSDHHHQPRGSNHRVQQGGGAMLRPSPREGPGHEALRRPLSARRQFRSAGPHQPLFGRGRRVAPGPPGRGDRRPRQRRDLRRRVGHDHQPGARRLRY